MVFRRRRTVWLLVLAPVVLAACSDSSLLFPRFDEPSQVRIQTLEAGSVLTGADIIPIQVVFVEGSTQVAGDRRLEVQVRDQAGVSVASYLFGDADLAAPGGLDLRVSELGPLEPGLYILSLNLFEAETSLAVVERRFFISGSLMTVEGISSYPASFWPGSSGLLVANLGHDPQTDPFLRWTMAEVVIAQGLRSEGFDEVLIEAPAAEGVYGVQLELFPSEPADPTLRSGIRQSGEIIVTIRRRLGETDLVPESSYYSLFHFLGDLRDDGARFDIASGAPAGGGGRVPPRIAAAVGDPDLHIRGDIFGYLLDGRDGFDVDGFVIPTPREGLSPFSVNARLLVTSLPEDAVILHSESADGAYLFRLSVDRFGVLSALLRTPEAEYASTSGLVAVRPGVPVSLSLSVIPEETRLHVMWFVDGLLLSTSNLPRPVPASAESIEQEGAVAAPVGDDSGLPPAGAVLEPDEPAWTHRNGRTIIGSDGVFAGVRAVLDELGVYFRDEAAQPASDEEVFRRTMEDRYGLALVYAQGFERLDLPEELLATGDVAIQSSRLILEPGATVTLPAFLFRSEQLILEVDLEDEAFDLPGRFLFTEAVLDDPAEDDDGPLFVVTSDGSFFLGSADEPEFVSDEPGDLLLRMTHREATLSVAFGDASVDVFPRLDAFEGLTLRIEHPTAQEIPLRIVSILARRESDELARRLNPLSAPTAEEGSN